MSDPIGELEGIYFCWFIRVHQYTGFALMWVSVLVLIFRLRRPRPTLCRVARQPGAVACFSDVAVHIAGIAESLISNLPEAWEDFSSLDRAVWTVLLRSMPTMVMVVPTCWTLFLLLRRWRSEPGWIDRSGRAVGWA